MKSFKHNPAFTIVELLIVIVIIGILAAITIVSFGGITSQANVASLQSDLDSNSRKLQLYFTQYGSYPSVLDGSNCPTSPVADTNYCLKATSGTTLTYQFRQDNTADYALYATKGSTIYKVTPSGQPFATNLSSVCPTGFIVVPGSTTYSTSSFCVMKYEAKCTNTVAPVAGYTTPVSSGGAYDNSTTACTAANTRGVISTASGFPIGFMTDQTLAATYASNTIGCTGCTLISEAQWMTIAQNVLSNPVNWSNNAVGSGFIYSGHNDNSPATALAASDDSNGYFGTNNTSGSQKRTLVLTNGETIWDMAGNLTEWTSGAVTTNPTGGPEWTAVTGGVFAASPYPSGTGISGASSWNSANGIGTYSYINMSPYSSNLRRGGYYAEGAAAGVLGVVNGGVPGGIQSIYTFRAVR